MDSISKLRKKYEQQIARFLGIDAHSPQYLTSQKEYRFRLSEIFGLPEQIVEDGYEEVDEQ